MPKKQNEHGNRDWMALTIAILSLVSSGVALWFSVLAPADVRVSVSAPVFQWQGTGPPPEPQLPGTTTSSRVLVMKATCAFANNGARIGTIDDLALVFQSDDGIKWLFLPYSIVGEKDAPFTLSLPKEPFHWIPIPGKQTAVYTYMFIAEPGANSDDIVLAAHKFHVTLYSWSPENRTPREQQNSTIDLNTNVVKTMNTGEFVSIPFEEERQQLQGLLK